MLLGAQSAVPPISVYTMPPQNTKWVSGIDANTAANAVRIAVARKLAVIVHAMWKTNTPFRWSKLNA